MRNIQYIFISFFILFLFNKCSYTTTKTKMPVLKDMKGLEKALLTLTPSAQININGQETTTNKKITNELFIDVTNGQRIPKEDDLKKALARLIGREVKSGLKDTSSFDTYQIKFISREDHGEVSKSTWVSYSFSSQELTSPYLQVGKNVTSGGFVYGGPTFTNKDSLIVLAMRDYVFQDTSDVSLRMSKIDDQEKVIVENHVNVKYLDNYLTHKFTFNEFINAYGTGKFRFEILSHGTPLASKEFEVK